MTARHPSQADLARYLLGSLAENEAESLERHLDECAECEATIDLLSPDLDTVVVKVRAGRPEDAFEDESDCRALVERIRQVDIAESRADQTSDVGAAGAAHPAIESLREYRLLDKIGQGGMGTVHKALHTKLGKMVALKLLPTHRMRDPAAIVRFEREMRAVGKLEHPNIVRATDAGEFDGMHYLVMELVEGIDLSRIANRLGRLPIPEASEIIRQAATGLQHAFERGLIHRDIKPSNLMLSGRAGGSPSEAGSHEPPVVKILDLGLALLEEAAPSSGDDLTSTGQLMGTVDYMAPEQADDTHRVDIRADIYALGATLYRLLSGRAPFSGPDYDTTLKKLTALVNDRPRPLRELRPGVPEELAVVVHRMLAKKSDERPSTPREVAELLRPFAAGADLAVLLVADESSPAIEPGVHLQSTAEPPDQALRPPFSARPARRKLFGPLIIGTAVLVLLVLVVLKVIDVRPTRNTSPLAGKTAINATAADAIDSSGASGKGQSQSTASRDRQVAEWVRAHGGTVSLDTPNGWASIRPDAELPAGNFGLAKVDFASTSVSDADLARLDDLSRLTVLIVTNTQIGDAGIESLGELPELQAIYLGGTQVGDAGVQYLGSHYPIVTRLHAGGTRITDRGVSALVNWPRLFEVLLERTRITDAAIETLIKMKGLRTVRLTSTAVSRTAIERLHAALPECRIESEFGAFGPEASESPPSEAPAAPLAAVRQDRELAEWVLSLGGTVGLANSVNGYVTVKPGDKLPNGTFDLSLLDFYNTAVTDHDLVRIDGLEHVTHLMFTDTAITDQGLAKLGDLPKLNGVYFAGTNVTDAGLRMLVERYPTIQLVHANHSPVTDEGLKALVDLPNFNELRIEYTDISDAALDTLVRLKGLRAAFLRGTEITRAGVERLHNELPECRIKSEYGDFGPSPPPTKTKAISAAPTQPSSQPTVTQSQQAAQWVHSLGGTVGLANTKRGYVTIRANDTIPDDFFELTVVDLIRKPVSDDDLAHFAGLSQLDQLMLNSCPIGDQGIAKLGELPKLKGIYIGGTKVTDAGLRMLVQRYPTIEIVHLGMAPITEDGLKALLDLPVVTGVRLEIPALTDAVIDTLVRLKDLRSVYLHGTQITRDGVERLRTALPECSFKTEYGDFGPNPAEATNFATPSSEASPPPTEVRRDREVVAWIHSLGGAAGLANTPRGYVTVEPDDELPQSKYDVVVLSFLRKPIDDSELSQVRGLPHLGQLMMHDTMIGDAGIANMGALPKLRAIYVSGTKVTDAGLRMLVERYPSIEVLHAEGIPVTDDGLKALLDLPRVVEVRIGKGAGISDLAIDTLMRLKHLRLAYIYTPEITRAGIERLHNALPECAIQSAHGDFGPGAR